MHKKIKILHIITNMTLGGAARVVFDMIRHLDTQGYKVAVVSGFANESQGDLFMKIDSKRIKTFLIPQLLRDINLFSDFIALAKLYKLMEKEIPDIVHTHTSKAGFLGRLAARLAGVKVIVHSSHGHIFKPGSEIEGVEGRPFRKRLFLVLERCAARFTNRIFVLTEVEKSEQVALKIAPEEKFKVVYDGIDLKKFSTKSVDSQNNRRQLGLDIDSPVIGTIGRLTKEKGHRFLIQAIANASKEIPDIQLLIIGDGPLLEMLKEQTRNLGIERSVSFLGSREDVANLLSIMDLFVLSSTYEGLGISILEAQAAGVPVVATNVGGIPEIVSDGQTGILVSAKDSISLANAITKLLLDRSLANKLAESARKKVFPQFGLKRMVEDFERNYEELLKEKEN